MKLSVREALQRIGLDVRRYRPDLNRSSLAKSLGAFHIDNVIDVGANCGQFAKRLRSEGYTNTILSFEPLAAAHRQLLAAASGDSAWFVHERSAVGDSNGKASINVASNSVSSSILPMLSLHASAAPESAYVSVETVNVITLDSVVPEFVPPSAKVFVKVDAQGYEWQVLDGAERTLDLATGVMCELSLVPLYEGQRLWREVLARLEESGFCVWAFEPGFTDLRNGRTLQVDVICFKQPRT